MDTLSAITTLKALDGLALRATVTAHNIANAQTKGFRPLRVTFEAALAAATQAGPAAVASVSPQTLEQTEEGATLRLDQELATATTTALRYGALVEVLNRQLQIASLAITGGR